jgi:CheY-like chemotaxis protein
MHGATLATSAVRLLEKFLDCFQDRARNARINRIGAAVGVTFGTGGVIANEVGQPGLSWVNAIIAICACLTAIAPVAFKELGDRRRERVLGLAEKVRCQEEELVRLRRSIADQGNQVIANQAGQAFVTARIDTITDELRRAGYFQGSQIRVLIVEDDQGVTRLLTDFLSREGLALEHAATVADALAKALAGEPDVILLDLKLGTADGLEVLRGLRVANSTARVLVVSGTPDPDRRSAALALGAAEVLPKPVDPDRLLAAIKRRGPPPPPDGPH